MMVKPQATGHGYLDTQVCFTVMGFGPPMVEIPSYQPQLAGGSWANQLAEPPLPYRQNGQGRAPCDILPIRK